MLVKKLTVKNREIGYLVSNDFEDGKIHYGWSVCNKKDKYIDTTQFAIDRMYKNSKKRYPFVDLPNNIKEEFLNFVKRSEKYFKKESHENYTKNRFDQKYLIFDIDHSLFIHKESKNVNKLFRKIYSSILDLYYKENKKIYEALKILHIDDVLFKQVVDNIAAYYYQPYPKLHKILCEFYRKSVIISYGFPPVMKKLCFEIYQELSNVPIFLNEDHKFENKLEMINFYTSVVLNKKPEDFIVFDDDEKLIQQLKIAGYYTNLIKTGDNFNV